VVVLEQPLQRLQQAVGKNQIPVARGHLETERRVEQIAPLVGLYFSRVAPAICP
jgi:hypothetical protein